MGTTKNNLFTAEQNEIAALAKALGHPARIAILQHLSNMDTCCNGDLISKLGLAQATVSQHLKELKKIGLIQGTITGTAVNYCINSSVMEEINTMLTTIFIKNNTCSPDGCC